MSGGYIGRILWVDLTRGEVSPKNLDEGVARKYIGGAGLAAKILWDETAADTDPLSPENLVMFMIGPLTGTPVPSSSRYCVAGISPLTNIWGEAYAGGFWAHELKCAGFDGIVLKGKAEEPVYLWVHDGEAKIVDATHVWGKDTYEVSDLLQKETDEKASVVAIGPAGEKLVRLACVINDGKAGRAAARCGLGAVMGSKMVKAIVVRGTSSPEVSNREKLRESINKHYPVMHLDEEEWRLSFREHRKTHWQKGRVNIKNYLEGEGEGLLEVVTEGMLLGKYYYCWGCRYSCSESRVLDEGRAPVYEGLVPLGTQCLVSNLEALIEATHLCNRYGIDSISTGAAIAFGMEAFEHGLVSKADTDGLDLTWGNHEAMIQMVRKIGENEGFGRVLGQGVRKAAEHIGGIAQEYAVHVKGLEPPAHDPRSSNALALEYATSNRGASHKSAGITNLTNFIAPEIGINEPKDSFEERYKTKGQGELVAKLQNFRCLLDSLVVCNMLMGGVRSGQSVKPLQFVEWLNYVTGWDMDLKEFLTAGERIFNLKRVFNARRGISRKDDILPPRILTHKRGGQSESAENLPPLGEMLNEYYAYRGWSEEGIPTKEKLADLGLDALQ